MKKCPLFEGINDEELAVMLQCLGAHIEHFDKKYTIFAEGYAARHIGVLLRGVAHTVQNDYYGKRSVLSVAKDGEVFGEAFACANTEVLPVSVIAAEPCEVMLIDASHIMHTCQNHCAFHNRLIFNLMRIQTGEISGLQKSFQFLRFLFEEVIAVIAQSFVDLRGVAVAQFTAQQSAFHQTTSR